MKRKKSNRLGYLGVALMVLAGAIVGLFAGAYFSNPIMSAVVDYQSDIIAGKTAQISELEQKNYNQADIIRARDREIDDLAYCYVKFNQGNITTYKEISEYSSCIREVEL
jgi:hypothetical protein